MENAAGGLIFLFLLVVYLVPSIIALVRGHINSLPIIATNTTLGWTVLGWVVALIWSLSNQKSK